MQRGRRSSTPNKVLVVSVKFLPLVICARSSQSVAIKSQIKLPITLKVLGKLIFASHARSARNVSNLGLQNLEQVAFEEQRLTFRSSSWI
jgi:hypothetical protein